MSLFLRPADQDKQNRFLGVLPAGDDPPDAEIIPVEPGQGNACAGKVAQHIPPFAFAAFLSNHFFKPIQ
jgi:hypothetical protein